MISKECREAINKATKILEPFSKYKFIDKSLKCMNEVVYREDWKIACKSYEKKRRAREIELLYAFLNEGKTIQYCYSRNRNKKPLIWDDIPKEKVRNFIEHGMWNYMKIKGEDDAYWSQVTVID